MTIFPVFVEVATPLLAIVSLVGVGWVRSRDRQVRRQAAHLQSRLESQLEALRVQESRIRQRIGITVDLYRGGNLAKKGELGQACDDVASGVESLRIELRSEAGRLQYLRGRALRDASDRIVAMANQGWDLAWELEERDQFWRRELDGMTAARLPNPRRASYSKAASA